MAHPPANPALFGAAEGSVASAAGYALVAPERGIDVAEGGLTYAVPEALADLAVGDRVRVPLGRKNKPAIGYVIELRDAPDPSIKQVKAIADREGHAVSLPGELVALARWIAAYYVCPLGMVLATMLPAAVKRGTGTTRRPLVRLAPGVDLDAEGDAPLKLTKLQRAVVEHAGQHRDEQDTPAWMDLKQLADEAGAKTTGPIKKLLDAGVLEQRHVEMVAGELEAAAQAVAKPSKPLSLTAAQQTALDKLASHLGGFHVSLLHGITGSGKTEVYLRLIEALLDREEDSEAEPRGVIVLVPEIALTPQTVSRFLARFVADHPGEGAPGVAVLHSGLTAAQRHAQWRRIRDGEARIVVGARSAVFAPLQRVGLILVDEEHDASYKQDQLPRYHARDVAIRRAQLAGCPVVLGSATPSLESYRNATAGDRARFHLLHLPDRVPGAKLPEVELVDLTKERQERRGVHLLSRRLEDRLRITLNAGGQAMLLLNRRGYANYVSCPDHRCGWLMACDHCDALMVYHVNKDLPAGGLVRCHHCTAEQVLPKHCPDCSRKVTKFGMGTQRIEEELERKFPEAKIARMDADAMRTGKDYQRTLDTFASGATDILLGTQMIAKGLDVPNVRLVGVVSADTSLNFPDFRAAERTFQLIAQVAGRAGRGEHPGTVVVQTFHPTDQTIRDAAAHDYEAFARRETETRLQGNLPPATRHARIVCRDPDRVVAFKRINELAAQLHDANAQLGTRVFLTPPAPCPIARVADHFRFQLELIAPDAAVLQKLLTAVRNKLAVVSDAHTAIDVDPVSLL